MARRKTHSEIIAKRCYDEAREALGAGWDHVSDHVRHALVVRNAWFVIIGQDDSIPPENVQRYMHELNDEIAKFFDDNGAP